MLKWIKKIFHPRKSQLENVVEPDEGPLRCQNYYCQRMVRCLTDGYCDICAKIYVHPKYTWEDVAKSWDEVAEEWRGVTEIYERYP